MLNMFDYDEINLRLFLADQLHRLHDCCDGCSGLVCVPLHLYFHHILLQMFRVSNHV